MTNGTSSSNSSSYSPILLFTSSNEVPATKEKNNGIYSCTLDVDENVNNYNYTYNIEKRGYCTNPWLLPLDYPNAMNLQFFVSAKSKENSTIINDFDHDNGRNDDLTINDDGNNYMYAASVVSHNPKYKIFRWDILRAIPNAGNGEFSFQSYFRTMNIFDFNSCGNFDCCYFPTVAIDTVTDTDLDYGNGNQTESDIDTDFDIDIDPRLTDPSYLHAHVRTKPRAFAVDETTGDVFVTWEGFYKSCHDATSRGQSTLDWTMGVSRVKTHAEDPTCVSVIKEDGEPLGFGDNILENNFVRCTEQVAIVYQTTTDNLKVGLPYGGFRVIPASIVQSPTIAKPRRSFLLSAFDDTGETYTQSHLWAIPEGGDVTRSMDERQHLSTTIVKDTFFDQRDSIWNGGNIRVHYNAQTDRPDHLCRSVFNSGIICMPVEVTVDGIVSVTGDEETFLTKDQVTTFCTKGNHQAERRLGYGKWKWEPKVVTGLDVLWNEDEGTPNRIFFGCWGGDILQGKIGSVYKDGANLTEVLPGAYSGDVVFLPPELDPSTVAQGGYYGGAYYYNDDWASTTSMGGDVSSNISSPQDSRKLYSRIAIFVVLGCLLVWLVSSALCGFCKRRISSKSPEDETKADVASAPSPPVDTETSASSPHVDTDKRDNSSSSLPPPREATAERSISIASGDSLDANETEENLVLPPDE